MAFLLYLSVGIRKKNCGVVPPLEGVHVRIRDTRENLLHDRAWLCSIDQ